MASVKNLKKDIQYLAEVVVTDAIMVSEMIDNKEDLEKADAVILEAVEMCNLLIDRANHPDGKDNPQLVKKYYKQISLDLLSQSDKMFTTLNGLLGIE